MRMYLADDMPNLLIAGGSSIPTWFAVIQDPSTANFLAGIAASVVLLFIGKMLDLAIKLALEFIRSRRGDDKTGSKIEGSNDSSEEN